MSRIPGWALLVAAVAAVGSIVFLIPDSKPDASQVVAVGENNAPQSQSPSPTNTSGVTVPAAEQPQLEIKKLAPGEKAPQFVVLSFDGGVESKTGLMTHYLDLAKSVGGRFSFYISGVYLIPDNKHKLVYDPPKHARGTSAIGFGDPGIIKTRIDVLTRAWVEGNEIGTHYMGHFCGANGVGAWNAADWTSEIDQFNSSIDDWRQNNPQAATAGPLPFSSEVVKGGRTPCLEGNRHALFTAIKQAGYVYDASGSGGLQWPKKMKKWGIWELPLEAIKVPHLGMTLSMDYNFLANQNNAQTTASPEKCAQIERDSEQAYSDALDGAYKGNRAPLILGNHMNNWVCNAYTNALTSFVKQAHEKYPDVQFISMLDLVHWMEAQDPAVLKKLQKQPAVY